MTTEERNQETAVEEEPAPTLEAEPEAAAEQPAVPEYVTIRVLLPAATNEELKSLATLWGETKTETARKLLIGGIQHHYSINKNLGRL